MGCQPWQGGVQGAALLCTFPKQPWQLCLFRPPPSISLEACGILPDIPLVPGHHLPLAPESQVTLGASPRPPGHCPLPAPTASPVPERAGPVQGPRLGKAAAARYRGHLSSSKASSFTGQHCIHVPQPVPGAVVSSARAGTHGVAASLAVLSGTLFGCRMCVLLSFPACDPGWISPTGG